MKLTTTDEQEAWRLLLIGQSRLREHFSARIKSQFGLSPAQFEALLVLLHAPHQCLTMSRLSRSLHYSSGSATNLIARLEQLEFVSRRPGVADQRVVEVVLTPVGVELIRGARELHFADLERVFAPLVPTELLPHLTDLARRMMTVSLDS